MLKLSGGTNKVPPLLANLFVILASICLLGWMQASAQTSSPTITYHLDSLTTVKDLRNQYTHDQILLLQKLNRRDLDHLLRLKTMVVPDQWYYNELYYSPLPDTYAWAMQYPKALVVYVPDQVFGAYENGRLVRWGPVSSGRKGVYTPTGRFNLKWKARIHTSTDNDEWLMPWYFNFINYRGLGFHQYELPGYPASHACIRLLEEDAVWIFGWGDQWVLNPKDKTIAKLGTPVLVLGEFQFGVKAPWRNLEHLGPRLALPSDPVSIPAP
jgi:hypothetical protein